MLTNITCLFCTTEINQCDWLENKLDTKRISVLTAIFRQLNKSFPFQFPSKCTVWDFKNQPFPFCKLCRNEIAKLCRLNDRITSIQGHIQRIVAKFAALAISSNTEMTSKNLHLGGSNSAMGELSGRGNPILLTNNDNQCRHFRNTIINGYSPRVSLKKIKAIVLEKKNTEGRKCLQETLNQNAFNCQMVGLGKENSMEKAGDIFGPVETFSDNDNDDICCDNDRDLSSESESRNSSPASSKNNPGILTEDFGDINKTGAEEKPVINSIPLCSDVPESSCEGKSEGTGEASIPKPSSQQHAKTKKVENIPEKDFYTVLATANSGQDSSKPQSSSRISVRSKKTEDLSRHKTSTTPGDTKLKTKETKATLRALYRRFRRKKVVEIDKNIYSYFNFSFHIKQDEFSCLGCDFKTTSTDAEIGTRVMKKHIIFSHDVKPAKPSEAAVRLVDEATETYTAYGYKFQSVEEGYKCSTCGKILKPRVLSKKLGHRHKKYANIRNHIQTVHMRSHRGNCPICNLYTANVVQHMQRKHPKRSTEKICDICGKSFKREGFASHMETHKDASEYKHQCDRCGKKFAFKRNLDVHYRTHTGEKPYVCEKCGRGFAFQHVLKTHLNGHEKIRPFACNQCEWTFGAKFLLVRHTKQVHEGIKAAPPKNLEKKKSSRQCT